MVKRIFSLVISLILCMSCINVSAIKNPSVAVVNETFDNYAFNDTSDYAKAVNAYGVDARVVERSNSNKALYAGMWGNAAKITVPLTQCHDKMVFSYEIMLEGDAVNGSVLSFGDGNSTFRYYEDGKIRLDNDMAIGGYRANRWTRYDVLVDFVTGTYDLYIDSECLFENRYFYSTPKKIKEFSFVFTTADEGAKAGVYVDNIRVYEGDEILPSKSFPDRGISTEVRDFTGAAEPMDNSRVFIESYGRDGISNTFSQSEGAKAEWVYDEQLKTNVISFVKTDTKACYAQIATEFPKDSSVASYVISWDFLPVKGETQTASLCMMYGAGDEVLHLIKMYTSGDLLIGGNAVTTLKFGEWVNVAAVCNTLTGTCDAYVDGVQIFKNKPLDGPALMPSNIRCGYLGSSSGSGTNEFKVTNLKIYEGTKLRKFSGGNSSEPVISDSTEYESVLDMNRYETQNGIKAHISEAKVFSASNSKCYINKEKRDYAEFSASPYVNSSGEMMIPADLFSDAFEMPYLLTGEDTFTIGKYLFKIGEKWCELGGTKTNLSSAPVNKDGIIYIPLESFCENALKKYVYKDERGYVFVDDSDRQYVNTSNMWEASDSIYRFVHYDRPSADKIYEDFKNSESYNTHPRILATADEFAKLREKIPSNIAYLNAYNKLLTEAENYMSKPPTAYDSTIRLNYLLIDGVGNIMSNLGIAYQLTGDKKYAERAWQELENALLWPDWGYNYSYLDSGDASIRIMIGYDCIYDYLTEAQRDFVNKHIQLTYIDPMVKVCTGEESRFDLLDSRYTESNWGAVCGEGMLSAALCFMDAEDENSELTKKCKFIAEQAIRSLEYPFGNIFPSGTSKEGFIYWEYYFSNLTRACDLVLRMCGDDYGFLSSPGFSNSILFGIYGQTKEGLWPFSDTEMDISVYYPSSMYEYAYITKDKVLADTIYKVGKQFGKEMDIKAALWYDIDENAEATLNTDYFTAGDDVTVMRQSWNNPDGLWLGVLGGTNSATLSHIDKGGFVFTALGEKWFVDLGRDNYSIPSYWGYEVRNKLYRIRTEGHNCLVINPSPDDIGQEINKKTEVTRFESSDRGAISVYDLTEVYGNKTSKYQRGFSILDDREAVLVQDELTLSGKSDLYWFAHTQADIKIADDGKSAVLSQNGKSIRVEFYSNAPDWKLEKMDAEPLSSETKCEGEKLRDGIYKLAFVAKGAEGDIVISAKIIPLDDSVEQLPLEYKPISNWNIPEGKIDTPALNTIKMNGTEIEGFSPDVRKYSIKLPYGSSVPYFEASSTNADFEIKQPESLTDSAVITVIGNNGRKVFYTVEFVLEIAVSNNLQNIQLAEGLADNTALINAKNVYASHEPQSDHLAPCATDGSFKTSWTSDNDGEYIEIDLGEVKDFDGVALAFLYGDERQYSFEILYSEDKQNYTRVFTGRSTGKTSEYECLPISGRARYIRLVGHLNTKSNWNNLAEFAVYKLK